MRILINIVHPASVHLFKNIIKLLSDNGHTVIVVARNKDVTFKLLDVLDIQYFKLGNHYKSKMGKLFWFFPHFLKFFFYSLSQNVDIFVDAGTIYPGWTAFLLRRKYICIENTDVDPTKKLVYPFADAIITPASFNTKNIKNQVICESFNELSFLHPKYFLPNPKVLNKLGVQLNEKYLLLRFVSWKAIDDIGMAGYNIKEIREIVKKFTKYGRVFISCEYELPKDLQKIQIEKNSNIPFGSMQDIEYYSSLFFGESGAMAAECAMLGVPSIFVSPKKLGFINELETKYGLVIGKLNKRDAIDKTILLLESEDLKKTWQENRHIMLKEKINYTAFLVWFIESFPESLQTMKNNPDYQYNFE